MAGKKKKTQNDPTLPLFDKEWLQPAEKPTSGAPKKRRPSKKKKTKAPAAPQERWQDSAKRIIYRGRRSRPHEFEDE